MSKIARVRSLRNLEGDVIVVAIPALGDHEFYLVRLHKVESAGIWVESQDFTERMMERLNATVSSTTLVLFLPFQQLSYVIASFDSISLSERSFGILEQPE